MNTVVIPMAGAGSRFAAAGYDVPKYLIPTADGRTILEWAVTSLMERFSGFRWVFVCLEDHLNSLPVSDLIFRTLAPEQPAIVSIRQRTEGQLESVLEAQQWIDPDGVLVIHNCDTYFVPGFPFQCTALGTLDGVIPVFRSQSPAYSYVDVDPAGVVTRVAEKEVLATNLASLGTYIFTHASDLILAAREIVAMNIRTHGEFYVSSVYKPLIQRRKRFGVELALEAWPIGTPDELRHFNARYLKS